MSNKREEFEEVVKPLIQFLNKHYHPHAKIIVSVDGAEVLEGDLAFNDESLVID